VLTSCPRPIGCGSSAGVDRGRIQVQRRDPRLHRLPVGEDQRRRDLRLPDVGARGLGALHRAAELGLLAGPDVDAALPRALDGHAVVVGRPVVVVDLLGERLAEAQLDDRHRLGDLDAVLDVAGVGQHAPPERRIRLAERARRARAARGGAVVRHRGGRRLGHRRGEQLLGRRSRARLRGPDRPRGRLGAHRPRLVVRGRLEHRRVRGRRLCRRLVGRGRIFSGLRGRSRRLRRRRLLRRSRILRRGLVGGRLPRRRRILRRRLVGGRLLRRRRILRRRLVGGRLLRRRRILRRRILGRCRILRRGLVGGRLLRRRRILRRGLVGGRLLRRRRILPRGLLLRRRRRLLRRRLLRRRRRLGRRLLRRRGIVRPVGHRVRHRADHHHHPDRAQREHRQHLPSRSRPRRDQPRTDLHQHRNHRAFPPCTTPLPRGALFPWDIRPKRGAAQSWRA